jgi:ketosteroid isomerase-like protein
MDHRGRLDLLEASPASHLWRIVMNVQSVREAINEGNRQFGSAVARKDYAALAALYTENAMVLPPDGPIVTGKPAIEEFWRSAASAIGLSDAVLKTRDLEVAGDTACEVGEANLKLGDKSLMVKYVVVWMKGGDGNWRVHRDIWNAMPAA